MGALPLMPVTAAAIASSRYYRSWFELSWPPTLSAAIKARSDLMSFKANLRCSFTGEWSVAV